MLMLWTAPRRVSRGDAGPLPYGYPTVVAEQMVNNFNVLDAFL